ncbi:MAG: alanine--tRNA ligase-related protein [Bauldia sp.]
MPTELLFRDDAYLASAEATVLAVNDRRGIVLDRTVFYATGGGQPGDTGALKRADGSIAIATHRVRRHQGRHRACAGRCRGAARAGRDADRGARLGAALPAHAHPHRAAPALGRAALSGDRRADRRRRGAARLFHRGRGAGEGGDRGEAECAGRRPTMP